MPLIECPMCGKMISPNAESCPNCGEPMKKNNENDMYCLVLNKIGDESNLKSKLLEVLGCNASIVYEIEKNLPFLLLDNVNIEKAQKYKSIFEGTNSNIQIIPKKECMLKMKYIPKFENENTIKCPNCKSTNVKKIGGLSKAGSVALFGVFAMGKVSKTYQCNKCGYRW